MHTPHASMYTLLIPRHPSLLRHALHSRHTKHRYGPLNHTHLDTRALHKPSASLLPFFTALPIPPLPQAQAGPVPVAVPPRACGHSSPLKGASGHPALACRRGHSTYPQYPWIEAVVGPTRGRPIRTRAAAGQAHTPGDSTQREGGIKELPKAVLKSGGRRLGCANAGREHDATD